MKFSDYGVSFWEKIKKGIFFYFRIFYDPILYRDIAFREKGYGLKRVFLSLFILMLPSFFYLYSDLRLQYQTTWLNALKKLPTLTLTRGELNKNSQTMEAIRQVDTKQFVWFYANHVDPTLFEKKAIKPFLLGIKNLWVNLPQGHYFGFNLDKKINYFPLIIWNNFHGSVSSSQILSVFNLQALMIYTIIYGLFMYFINCFYAFLFIRTFAIIARRMVLIVLKDTIDYDVACRLLSVTLISSMIILAFIINIKGFNEHIKFLMMVIFMFYYYLALRFVKAKSEFRWLSGIK